MSLHEHGFESTRFHDFETELKTMRFRSAYTEQIPRGGGEGYSLIWVIRVRATGQGMVFWPRCPKQGIQLDLPLS